MERPHASNAEFTHRESPGGPEYFRLNLRYVWMKFLMEGNTCYLTSVADRVLRFHRSQVGIRVARRRQFLTHSHGPVTIPTPASHPFPCTAR